MADSTTATGTGGNPFTNTDATARLHANANAAFMRATRPGSSGDAGGGTDAGGSSQDFSTDGQAHPWEDAHPDQTAVVLPRIKAAKIPRF